MKPWREGYASALTLIEVLIVVAIIGILAALLLAGISRAKGRAQQIQCVNNLHQLGRGLQGFLANNHGYPSAIAGEGDDYPGTWMAQLSREGLGASKLDKEYFTTGVWRCPSAQWSTLMPADSIPTYYSYNAYGSLRVGNMTNALGLLGHRSADSHKFVRIAESEVANPSDMMAVGDSFDAAVFFMRSGLAGLERYGNIRTRHHGKVNLVFCDGHVESPTLEFVFEDTSDAALVRWNRDHLPHRELLGQ